MRRAIPFALLLLAAPAAAQPTVTDGGVALFAPDPAAGELALGPDDADAVQDYTGQGGHLMHVRLSRPAACNPWVPRVEDGCDMANPFARDFTWGFYRWGATASYPGLWELNLSALSIHANHQACYAPFSCNGSGQLLVGDQWDAGGWYFTAAWDSYGAPSSDRGYVVMAADKWDHTSHGDIRMQVRDPGDVFAFQSGQYGAEQTVASISADGALTCTSVVAPVLRIGSWRLEENGAGELVVSRAGVVVAAFAPPLPDGGAP